MSGVVRINRFDSRLYSKKEGKTRCIGMNLKEKRLKLNVIVGCGRHTVKGYY